ncbi:zinc finger protein 846 [Kryptolebias marmoratus]|uniref:C2H2-type domain-containing protein n=1 Tax=Kryptolebias marmoratus TaxID=37003 RepID=A0A3Q2ZDH1_KRYMA|nr:zinc finger protein 846 [Kryptolebias marmoratus]
MISVHHLRDFIGDRLTAAAAEIFSEFEKTILRYEEELDRQRRLLDVRWNPKIKQLSVDLQQEPVHKTELILTDQERNSSLDWEEPERPWIKGEQEEPELQPLQNQEEQEDREPEPPEIKEEEAEEEEEDQLHLKQETDPFLVTVLCEEREPEPDGEQLASQSSAGPEDQDPFSWPDDNTERALKKVDLTDGHRGNEAAKSGAAEGLFSCPICWRTFSRKAHLSCHMKVHRARNPTSGKLQYCCPICGKRFSACSYLIIHIRSHTGEKPFPCEVCGKGFSIKDSLKVHMRIHTGEKPFFCETCGKRFNQASLLKRHMRLHSGVKTFTCQICAKHFIRRDHLTSHMKIHEENKQFSCQTCGKSFVRNDYLKSHVKVHKV